MQFRTVSAPSFFAGLDSATCSHRLGCLLDRAHSGENLG
jgi:hypothetical protein